MDFGEQVQRNLFKINRFREKITCLHEELEDNIDQHDHAVDRYKHYKKLCNSKKIKKYYELIKYFEQQIVLAKDQLKQAKDSIKRLQNENEIIDINMQYKIQLQTSKQSLSRKIATYNASSKSKSATVLQLSNNFNTNVNSNTNYNNYELNFSSEDCDKNCSYDSSNSNSIDKLDMINNISNINNNNTNNNTNMENITISNDVYINDISININASSYLPGNNNNINDNCNNIITNDNNNAITTDISSDNLNNCSRYRIDTNEGVKDINYTSHTCTSYNHHMVIQHALTFINMIYNIFDTYLVDKRLFFMRLNFGHREIKNSATYQNFSQIHGIEHHGSIKINQNSLNSINLGHDQHYLSCSCLPIAVVPEQFNSYDHINFGKIFEINYKKINFSTTREHWPKLLGNYVSPFDTSTQSTNSFPTVIAFSNQSTLYLNDQLNLFNFIFKINFNNFSSKCMLIKDVVSGAGGEEKVECMMFVCCCSDPKHVNIVNLTFHGYNVCLNGHISVEFPNFCKHAVLEKVVSLPHGKVFKREGIGG